MPSITLSHHKSTLRQPLKNQKNIASSLGRSLVKGHFLTLGQHHTLLTRNCPLLLQIRFVPNQHRYQIRLCKILYITTSLLKF